MSLNLEYIEYYAKLYQKLYDRINSGKLTPLEVINIQEDILNIVETLKSEAKNPLLYEIYNYEYLIETFRMLVNNILSIYVIGTDITVIRKLTTSQYGEDNYNVANINYYFEICHNAIKEYHNIYLVVLDLCMGNLQLGDIIYRYGKTFDYLEVKKDTPKNNAMIEALMNNDDNPFTEKHDIQQFERIKKQHKRNLGIINKLESPYSITNNGVTLPYNLRHIKKFSNKFNKAVNSAQNQLCKEIKVDSCVSIITADIECINYICDDKPLQALQHAQGKYRKPHKNLRVNEELQNWITNVPEDGITKILYNNVLQEAFLPQPYLAGIRGQEISKILTGKIGIYIKIDIEKLFQKLRDEGFAIYPKKGSYSPAEFYYKKKNWIIKKKDDKDEGFPLGLSIIHRIAYAFYTTDDIIYFIKNYLLFDD